MAEPMDDRYANFREHAELRERTATLEATMAQVGPALARIETMVAARNAAPQQQAAPDHVVLALQRAADVFERGKQSGGGGNAVITIFAIIGALAIGALAVLLLTGG